MNMKKIICALLSAVATASFAADKNWTPLFNGRDLDGWAKRGAGIFTVEDGAILGTQTDGKGGDLFTTNRWDNFELRFTYKVGWPANSGIWYRDSYQFDILKYPRPVAFSGTLYAPGRVFAATNTNESLEHRDDWNEGRIFANGDHLVQWLNGTKTADIRDDKFKSGRIGIQVHPGEMKGMKIFVKKIEIRPLAPDEQPAD